VVLGTVTANGGSGAVDGTGTAVGQDVLVELGTVVALGDTPSAVHLVVGRPTHPRPTRRDGHATVYGMGLPVELGVVGATGTHEFEDEWLWGIMALEEVGA
jgi:hypothetical protein